MTSVRWILGGIGVGVVTAKKKTAKAGPESANAMTSRGSPKDYREP